MEILAATLNKIINRSLLPGLLAVLLSLSGCAIFKLPSTGGFSDNLADTILEHDNPELVAKALPAYILTLETLIRSNPDDASMLKAHANLTDLYAAYFVPEKPVQQRLANSALNSSLTAACLQVKSLCGINKLKAGELKGIDYDPQQADLDYVSTLVMSWLLYIQTHSDDWDAVAQIAHVEYFLGIILATDETHKDGIAHLYMGILALIVPPALGGDPERSQKHFKRALEISPDSLSYKVAYAKYYARPLFDQELHDRLLNEVLNATVEADQHRLQNIMAQREAKQLMESAEDYF
jgi:hypothetical protein